MVLPLWLEALYCFSSTIAKWVPPQGPCGQPCDLCPLEHLDVRENIAPRTVPGFGTCVLHLLASGLTWSGGAEFFPCGHCTGLSNSPLNPGIGWKHAFKAMAGIQNQPTFSVHAVTMCTRLGEGRAPGRRFRVAFMIPAPLVNLPLKVWFCHEPERNHNPLINQCSLSSYYVSGLSLPKFRRWMYSIRKSVV